MSNPTTMAERAAAYMAGVLAKREPKRADWIEFHLAAFAAREVARVRQEAVDACDAVLGPLTNGGARNAVKAVRGRIVHASLPHIDDALRERGLKHVGFVEKGGVVTDVNHKPVNVGSPELCEHASESPRICRCAVWCHCKRNTCKPAKLSALARNVKKGKTR